MMNAVLEIEESITDYSANPNGTWALWACGAPMLVRMENEVIVSIYEVRPELESPCNSRPRLFLKRDNFPWELAWRTAGFNEREPCPIAQLPGNRLLLYAHPPISDPCLSDIECQPVLLELRSFDSQPIMHFPSFNKDKQFNENSYRGLATDSTTGETLALCMDDRTDAHYWAVMNQDGEWVNQGESKFPTRVTYEQAFLQDGACHILWLSNQQEPNTQWHEYKQNKTGREIDLVYRKLYYSWSSDIRAGHFHAPIELDCADEKGGFTGTCDVWVDKQGSAHFLYTRMTTTPMIRDGFFPDEPIRTSLMYKIVREGKTVHTQQLMIGGEGLDSLVPMYARFHSTDGEQLFMIWAASQPEDPNLRVNGVTPLLPTVGEPMILPVIEPFGKWFMTNSQRGGNSPSVICDVWGETAAPCQPKYYRIRLG